MTVFKSLLLEIPLGSDHHWHRCSVQSCWPCRHWPFVRSVLQNLHPWNECLSRSFLCRRPTTSAPIRWTAWYGIWTDWGDGLPPCSGCPCWAAARWRHRSWYRILALALAGSRRVPSRSTRRTTATGNGSALRRSACTRYRSRWPPPSSTAWRCGSGSHRRVDCEQKNFEISVWERRGPRANDSAAMPTKTIVQKTIATACSSSLNRNNNSNNNNDENYC